MNTTHKKTTEELLKEKEKLLQQHEAQTKKIKLQMKKLMQLEKINAKKDRDRLLVSWAESLLANGNAEHNLDLFLSYANSLWENQQDELFKKYKVKMTQDEAIQKATNAVWWIKNGILEIEKGLKEQQEKINNPVKETKNI